VRRLICSGAFPEDAPKFILHQYSNDPTEMTIIPDHSGKGVLACGRLRSSSKARDGDSLYMGKYFTNH